MPMVIRVDGRAFHSIPLAKPFDQGFFYAMRHAALELCAGIQGAVLAYQQSDEISIIARDDMQNTTEPWLGKRLSRVVSLAAAIATSAFNSKSTIAPRQFDARAFVVPDLNEVTNYLIWRQQDAVRNSISMAARALFSHAVCNGNSTPQLLGMLRRHGAPWEEQPTHFRRGAVFLRDERWTVDLNPPTFTEDRGYIERLYRAPEGAHNEEKCNAHRNLEGQGNATVALAQGESREGGLVG